MTDELAKHLKAHMPEEQYFRWLAGARPRIPKGYCKHLYAPAPKGELLRLNPKLLWRGPTRT